MREAESAVLEPHSASKPYHHGDLSRALIQAGRRILEAEGPAGLSLRAVAREAGVSPAAPYHHFKDKGELLDAIASEGWREMGAAIAQARATGPSASSSTLNIGVAYVCFARDNPALYRLMYKMARDKQTMEGHAKDAESGWSHVREALKEAGADVSDERELTLATIGAWCAAHGVAEMAGFKEFERLKAELGGEEAFVRAVLSHIVVFPRQTMRYPCPDEAVR
ncbi:MAG TPA: TetR/AcrR family transcriptional regulator [Caulobacteraceae bacterium]|nr:TetR/AcrR family transcriptional regulator [Caulobacteraceae bacterium]